jgi:catechol 2,3-dioxygenase-like lactoylglutathione lyase family enzyme
MMSVRVVALDHVQLAMPAGGEARADAFYCGVLGFSVIPKPEPLASRGGRWYGQGTVQVHLGIEEDFRPARKAHPALVVEDFDELLAGLAQAAVDWVADDAVAGLRRCFVEDPFGNRIELIGAARRLDNQSEPAGRELRWSDGLADCAESDAC